MTVSPLDFPIADAPAEAEVREVSPGVLWLRQPLPFALDHINLWLLRGQQGWTVVDTGIGSSRSRAMWETVFERHLGGLPVERVLVTHFHPDHMGLADWMVRRWGVALWMTQGEWLLARLLNQDQSPELAAAFAGFYRRSGLTGERLDSMLDRGNAFPRGVPAVPATYRRIRHGERLRLGDQDWTVIGGGGHSPEHAALHCPALGLLISGDQVLPRISPNVSVWPSEPEADPLADFLAGLDRLRGLATDTLVLPSHGAPFRGLETRLEALASHHRERLEETLDHCRERPLSGAELMDRLFRRPLDTHQTSFAIGEALAHAHHMVAKGGLTVEDGADGVRRFWTA
ncbi:MAG: hypothetical protein RLY86_2760 [Pseudomonadota bacterium]|jgi:glyoxylase-like metal-dependent hydrolase (beta-lactamase superfamily II)